MKTRTLTAITLVAGFLAMAAIAGTFVRYADDANVDVGSRRAGERVMRVLRDLFSQFQLWVNEAKSAVAPATARKLLGDSLRVGPAGEVKRREADKAKAAMKGQAGQITRRTEGQSLRKVVEEVCDYLLAWKEYFRWQIRRRFFGARTSRSDTG